MIDFTFQTPWLDNGGDFCFVCFEVFDTKDHGRIAVGLFGFLIGVIFYK